MTTINAPFSHSEIKSDLGYTYVHAEGDLELGFMDSLDMIGLGIVRLKGDVAGTGSDVLRIGFVDGIGYDQTMDALASETDAPTAKTATTGYSSVTVAPYGLAYEETYFQQILGLDKVQRVMSLRSLVQVVPQNYAATVRSLSCTVGAAFGTDVGSKSSAGSVSDLLDLVAAATQTLGIGAPVYATINPVQLTQYRSSAENHPAYQNSMSDFAEVQALRVGLQTYRNLLGLGIDFAITDDVGNSGGGYDGFCHQAGGIGYAVGNTANVELANPMGAIVLPERGVIIERRVGAQNQQTAGFNALGYLGVAAASSSTHFQRGLVSST